MILPVANFLVVETVVILSAGVTQSVVIRMISLNQDLTRPFTAASTTRDLRDELKRALCLAEVG